MLLRSSGVESLWDIVPDKKKTPDRWIVVQVVKAYIHCSEHSPILAHLPGDASIAPGSGDFFKAKNADRPWIESPAPGNPYGARAGSRRWSPRGAGARAGRLPRGDLLRDARRGRRA